MNSSLNAALEILGILGPLLAAVSAVFLIRSSRSLTPFLVAKLAGTFWNYNPHLLASLSEEALHTVLAVDELPGLQHDVRTA